MKKFRKIGYIALIVIIIVLSLTIYTNASKNDQKDQKDKTFTEIKFLESKLKNLLNTMNNIETRNYKISSGEISKESKEESNSKKEGSSNSSSEEGGSESGSSSGEESKDSSEQENSTKFELEKTGVLTNSEDINWKEIKSQIENLYTSIPNITIDLYKINLNQEDILSFNREFDNLTLAVKDENKKDTLTQLSRLYDYIPKFAQNATDEEVYKKSVETKSNIFKAYSKLDNEDWNEISTDINNAINIYSQLLTDTNVDNKKQYSINRVYIMLNELQNAVSIKDTSVFLVKYKNIAEDIDSI